MALLDFQTSLARLVHAGKGSDPSQPGSLTANERAYLSDLTGNPAFRFTVKVQRSWCAGRAAKAAYLTLSILPANMRDQLLEEWVSAGGGTHSFVGRESAAFLEFIASHLVEPSHELTICRMELAALRSSEGSLRFKRPESSRTNRPDGLLRRGPYASVVHFYADPERVLNALVRRDTCPPVSAHITTLIFGPGFDRLYTTATSSELALYDRLASPVAALELSREDFARETIQRLLDGGVIEYVG